MTEINLLGEITKMIAGFLNLKNRKLIILIISILLFNLFWYGSFLSFPVFQEDGALNYSVLLELLQFDEPWNLSLFPIRWLDFLGQQTVIVRPIFDPFSWPMILGMEPGNGTRLAYALRATTCWLTTYLLVTTLFKGKQGMAITSGLLCMCLNYMMANGFGVVSDTVIQVASRLALFPGLLWLYLLMVQQKRLIGWADATFAIGFIWFSFHSSIYFILSGSVLFVFVFGVLIVGWNHARKSVIRGALKYGIIASLVLFIPKFGLYHTWSAITGISARKVFFSEAPPPFGQVYELPLLWREELPIVPRICIVLALATIIFHRRWSSPLKVVLIPLLLVVGGSQLFTLVRVLGIGPAWLNSLSRPVYFEWYITVFYSIMAAYGLHHWQKWLKPPHFSLVNWSLRFTVFIPAVWVLFPFPHQWLLTAWLILGLTCIIKLWLWPLIKPNFPFYLSRGLKIQGKGPILVDGFHQGVKRLWLLIERFLPPVVIAALFGTVFAIYSLTPEQIPTISKADLLCHERKISCQDPVGRTILAGTNPIIEFLKSQLAIKEEGTFRGRAEFLAVPSLTFPDFFDQFPTEGSDTLTQEEFETILGWYKKIDQYNLQYNPDGFAWFRDYYSPDSLNYQNPSRLLLIMDILLSNSNPQTAIFPDDILLEIVQWSQQHPQRVNPLSFPNNWQELSVHGFHSINEGRKNFFFTGHAMLSRTFQVQGIPNTLGSGSGYDYLSSLFLNKYIGQSDHRSSTLSRCKGWRSWNCSETLEAIESGGGIYENFPTERGDIQGLRYLVVRDSPVPIQLNLPRVMSWEGYSVYELPSPNTQGYSPTQLVVGKSLTEELQKMREPNFDPRQIAVVSETDQPLLTNFMDNSPLSPLDSSSIKLSRQSLIFQGKSSGQKSLAVLPFKFSHCWRPHWKGKPGELIRVDNALIGVLFEKETQLRLSWSAGYGLGTRCLREDASLIPQALEAWQS